MISINMRVETGTGGGRVAMRGSTKKELILFFILTLTVMYLLCFTVVLFLAPLKAFSARYLGGVDPQLILYPAAYSPTLVAFGLTGWYGGRAGLRRLLASIFRWRVGITPWLLAFLFFPAIWLAVAIIRHFAVGAAIQWQSWYLSFPQMVLSTYILTDTGGLGEETGWRGYAMPRLLEGFTPTAAGLIVGVFFGVWHLPGWFLTGLGGHFAQLDFAMFVGYTMLLSVGMAYLYLRCQGSVLLAGIIPHMVNNIGHDVRFFDETWEFLGYLAIALLILITVEARRMLASPPFNSVLSAREAGTTTPLSSPAGQPVRAPR